MMKGVKPQPHSEMLEGPEAWVLFRAAMKTIIKVPKSAMPPSPFKKTEPTKAKSKNPKQGSQLQRGQRK
jgi:hypothetical protein